MLAHAHTLGLASLAAHGACSIHRRSFAPVKAALLAALNASEAEGEPSRRGNLQRARASVAR